MNLNITDTYSYIIENRAFFFNILEFIRDNKEELPNEYTLPKDFYEKELFKYINNIKSESDAIKIEKALSISNLYSHDFVLIENNFEDIEYLSIDVHIIKIFQNIYKEYMTPLTDTQYKEHITLVKSYRKQFEESTLIKSKGLDEKVDAILELLGRIENDLKGTYKTLKYKKEHLSNEQNQNTTLKKLKEVKELNNKYILPIYTFTNDKATFITELITIIKILKDREKLYLLRKKIELYIQRFYIYADRIRPIRIYISKYIEQNEREILLNISTEKRMDEINEIIYNLQKINSNKKYIYKMEGLCNIDFIFKNSTINNTKDKNIKTMHVKEDNVQFLLDFIDEEIGKNIHKIKTTFYENKQFEEINLRNELRKVRTQQVLELNKLFDIHLQKHNDVLLKNNIECTEFIERFLSEKEWNIGDFQYLVKKLLEYNNKNIKIELGRESTLIRNKVKTTYYKFYIKNKEAI